MSKYIALSVPNLKGNEEKYVIDAIRQEWVSTGGSYITQFEENIAQYVKSSGAVACQSGTAGLHLALQLSGVEQNDGVIVPTLTFIAAVNPIKYIGADPMFMDCDDTLTIDVKKLKAFCTEQCNMIGGNLIHNKTRKHIKAIVIVHIFGNLANMEAIMGIAEEYNLKVIEDATEALGSYYIEGKYKNKFAGTIGDYGVYSFNGNKIITTGGGGMLIAQNKEILKRAKYLSTQAKDDELYYIHDEIGYNYRMTNIQAAIGVAQLEQLESFIETKKKNYNLYCELLGDVNHIKVLSFENNIRPNYWFYSLLIDFEKLKISQKEFIEQLGNEGIQTRPIWGLIHEQKPYKNSELYNIEKAKEFHKRIVNIPCSSNLTEVDVKNVVKIIKRILNKLL